MFSYEIRKWSSWNEDKWEELKRSNVNVNRNK